MSGPERLFPQKPVVCRGCGSSQRTPEVLRAAHSTSPSTLRSLKNIRIVHRAHVPRLCSPHPTSRHKTALCLHRHLAPRTPSKSPLAHCSEPACRRAGGLGASAAVGCMRTTYTGVGWALLVKSTLNLLVAVRGRGKVMDSYAQNLPHELEYISCLDPGFDPCEQPP